MEEDWSRRRSIIDSVRSSWRLYRLVRLSFRQDYFLDLLRVRDGELTRAKAMMERLLSFYGFELHPSAIVGSAKVCWVVDFNCRNYIYTRALSCLDSKLRFVSALQASLNDWLKGRHRLLMYSICKSCADHDDEVPPEEPSEPSIPSYAVVVSAVLLLSLVYQYLTGNVNRGGSKACSRSSLDFRDIYVAIVLFVGAYVWIKFREVAPKGVHPRKLVDKQGRTKEVYEARLTPPMWNGEKVPRLNLGQFATPQEAHDKFRIAAFYYNRDAGLLDGWFQVPPMSVEERSLTGLEFRAWVISQAKKVYEDYKKKKAEEALFLQDLFEALEVQATPDQDEVYVNPCGSSLLNSAEHIQPALVSQAENSGVDITVVDNHGLEFTSHSFDGMHEGLALSNVHNLGFQEGSALQLPPNTESGMNLNGSDQWDFLQTRVGILEQQSYDQRQQISDQQQQLFDQQQWISLQQSRIQELGAQLLQLQHQQRIQQQPQLQESRIQNPQWSYQFFLQEQQLQDVNQGVPGFQMEMEMEMEQSMHQPNYSGLMAPPPDGGEVQEAFF